MTDNTVRKKIMVIDGGPRSNMNTAAMVAAFVAGVREGGGEAKVVRLYDIDYKGCRSCMACKLKRQRETVCCYPDGLASTLNECAQADGLVIASPIYFGEMTGMARAFWERLTFPWLDYVQGILLAPRKMPVTFIYTMNGSPSNAEKIRRSTMRKVEMMTDMALSHELHQDVEVVIANNTTQVSDYNRYHFPDDLVESKRQWRNTHWENDLRAARDAGERMVAM